MIQIWKDIEGYEGIYQVSNTGKVKAVACFKIRGRHMQFRGEYLLKPKIARNGYLQVCLCKDKNRKWIAIHRIVANAFLPNLYNKPTVNHIDGNKQNNWISNLEYATNKEQINHADANGLRNIQGENHKLSKLKKHDVLSIRASNFSIAKLAKLYGVNKTCISKVKQGKTWRHI